MTNDQTLKKAFEITLIINLVLAVAFSVLIGFVLMAQIKNIFKKRKQVHSFMRAASPKSLKDDEYISERRSTDSSHALLQ